MRGGVCAKRAINRFRRLTRAPLQLFLSPRVGKHGRAFDARSARFNVRHASLKTRDTHSSTYEATSLRKFDSDRASRISKRGNASPRSIYDQAASRILPVTTSAVDPRRVRSTQ